MISLFRETRAIREFTDEPVPRPIIMSILEYGHRITDFGSRGALFTQKETASRSWLPASIGSSTHDL
ncbi:hypothetical protein [Brevibacillus reuszeri]|uniref:hypothetical protein n=1 Tax=Brevibacillus reuszeri TaxID=54915 RepID=UPI003D1B7524